MPLGAIVVTTDFVARHFRPSALLLVVLLFCAPAFLSQSLSILEYPYVVLVASLYVSAVFGDPHSRDQRQIFGCALLGVLGSLARSDFGGLPLMIFVACACFAIATGVWRYLYRSMAGLAGASVGLGVVFVHNYWFSGQLLSGSVRAKALWATRLGYQLDPSIKAAGYSRTNAKIVSSRRAGCCGGHPREMAAAPTSGIVRSNRSPRAHAHARRLTIHACRLGSDCALHSCLWCRWGVQPWYTADFVIPFVLALGPCSVFLRATLSHRVAQRLELPSYAREMCRRLFSPCGGMSTIRSPCRTTFDNIRCKVKSGAGMPESWATSSMAEL